MKSENSISKLIKGYKPGYSLEQAFYKNPDLYKKEIENIFHKHWILAGHISQIPEVGDFFLFEFANESIIVTRSKDGSIKALLNVCRHRGSRVCLEDKGNAKAFTCPYHAWSFDLDGKLIAARYMNDDFDKSENGLHRAHVELAGGLIFISLAEHPLSLSQMQDDLADVFDQFGFDNMKLAIQKTYPINANWKLANENYQECYHCAPSHKDFAKIHAMALNPAKFDQQKETFLKTSESNIRTKPSSFYFDLAKDGQEGYQYDRNPLIKGMMSGSKGGKPVAPLLGKLEKYECAASEFMVGPVTFFLIYDDHMLGYRFLPTSLDECICDLFWFVRGDAVEGKDYDLETLTWLWHETILDDEKIIIDNKKGVDSHFYKPGKLSDMEAMEQHFLDWYIKSIS
jgi:phenylpropionate dioxygenase-like ring-hydroxylating dioxygenase large terminal subunit|tara:strand:+ start:161399 stop:162595 length:1197 start_codon:yes stop_codon:yes gene_type:complete